MKNLIIIIVLFLSAEANAWDKKPKLPDATLAECTAIGKSLVHRYTRKNGITVRAHCRGIAKPIVKK